MGKTKSAIVRALKWWTTPIYKKPPPTPKKKQRSRQSTAPVARCSGWLTPEYLFVDTETTGLGRDDEIVELCILDHQGQILFNRLIKPKTRISEEASRVSGIAHEMLKDECPLPTHWVELEQIIRGRTLVAWNAQFDARLFEQSAKKHKLALPDISWQCAMKRYANGGMVKLSKAAKDLSISPPKPLHRAHADAQLCFEVVRQMEEHGVPAKTRKVRAPSSKPGALKGNPEGPLFGEVAVLTGEFQTSKADHAHFVAQTGCSVAQSVTKKTTVLIVGDARFSRGERSGKWTRAEELIEQGYSIRIMSESEFHAELAPIP